MANNLAITQEKDVPTPEQEILRQMLDDIGGMLRRLTQKTLAWL